MDNEVLKAERLITKYCNTAGRYIETGDIAEYIYYFANNMEGNIDGFSGRVHQPLKAALLLIVHEQFSSELPSDRNDYDQILAGGTALSAMYLMARLENLFRIKSQYLNEDGTLKNGIPMQLRQILKREYKKEYNKDINIGNKWRCSRINQAFNIFLYRNRTLLGKRLKIMDKKLRIADRLDYIRNPAMHGELDDPGVEARFLGLLVAMFYYGLVSPNKKTLTPG